jgi:hypothetical protein
MKFEKSIIVGVILALLLVGFVWYGYSTANQSSNGEDKSALCTGSGGTIEVAFCCSGADEFPNTCSIGACGCSLENSKEIRTCNCGEDKCWDGERCK